MAVHSFIQLLYCSKFISILPVSHMFFVLLLAKRFAQYFCDGNLWFFSHSQRAVNNLRILIWAQCIVKCGCLVRNFLKVKTQKSFFLWVRKWRWRCFICVGGGATMICWLFFWFLHKSITVMLFCEWFKISQTKSLSVI